MDLNLQIQKVEIKNWQQVPRDVDSGKAEMGADWGSRGTRIWKHGWKLENFALGSFVIITKTWRVRCVQMGIRKSMQVWDASAHQPALLIPAEKTELRSCSLAASPCSLTEPFAVTSNLAQREHIRCLPSAVYDSPPPPFLWLEVYWFDRRKPPFLSKDWLPNWVMVAAWKQM